MAVVLVLLAVAAGAAFFAAGRSWQQISLSRSRPLADVTIAVTGKDADAAVVPLVLVTLASILALLATRGWARRAVGALLALVGATLIWRGGADAGGAGDVNPRAVPADRHLVGVVADSYRESVSRGWPWLVAFAGMVVVVCAAVIVWRGHRWPAMSAKYDAPAAEAAQDKAHREEAATQTVRRDSGKQAVDAGPELSDDMAWRRMDRGEDPTL